MKKKDLVFLALTWTCAFALLEVGMRTHRLLTAGRESAADSGLRPLAVPTSLVIPHPYAAFVLNPERGEHNSQGFRAPKDKLYGRDPEALTIACLGESSTYGLRVAPEHSYPSRLERELSGRLPGRRVEVVNAGVPGYSTPNILALLSLRVVPLKPDLVLLYAGFNDAWTRLLFPGFQEDYAHAQKSWVEAAFPLWRRSLLLDRLADRLGYPNSRDPVFQTVAWHARGGDPQENWMRSSGEPFRRNLATFAAIARAHGAVPVFITQATNFGGHPDKVRQALPQAMEEHMDILRRAARELRVELIDVRGPMSDRPEYFRDFVHMSEAGNARRAEVVADALLGKGLLRRSGTRR
jgi:lysophospholipase L1-like esterase